MWVLSVFIARYPAPLPGPARPYWPRSHAITTSLFAAPPRVTGCTPNPPQTPTAAALTYYKHLGVRVYRWKHAKSGSGTICTPTMHMLPPARECTLSLPSPGRGRPSCAMIFRHPPRMNHAGRFTSVRWLGLANPSGGSCHPSWHPPRNTERPNSLSTRWLFFSIKPA